MHLQDSIYRIGTECSASAGRLSEAILPPLFSLVKCLESCAVSCARTRNFLILGNFAGTRPATREPFSESPSPTCMCIMATGAVERRQAEPVKRPVALKLIKRGMDSKGVLARFEQEPYATCRDSRPCVRTTR